MKKSQTRLRQQQLLFIGRTLLSLSLLATFMTLDSSSHSFYKNLFIYFWLRSAFVEAYRLSLVAVSRGYALVEVHRLLTVVASFVEEHGF